MKCPNCDAENRTDAQFCATCGSRLTEPTPQRDWPAETAHETPVEDIEDSSANLEREPSGDETAGIEPEETTRRPGEPAPNTDEGGIPAMQPEPTQHEQDSEEQEPRDSQGSSIAHSESQEPEYLEADSTSNAGAADKAEQTASTEAEASEEGLTPLPAGTLLADRYEIVELMSSEENSNLYIALDLTRCSVCGFDENTPNNEYCNHCGAALDSPAKCEIQEQPEPVEPQATARFTADGRTYAVLVQEAANEAEADKPAPSQQIQLRWAARTDSGQVRQLNEDCVDVHIYDTQGGPALGLFVVADGVGGQAAGEVASQLVTHVIWETIRETIWLPELQGEPVLPETIETRIEEAVQAANQAVYRQRTEQGTDMGTTVTLALVRDTVAIIANVGDSRTYRWNADGLRQLTIDHSLVQSLIDAGEVDTEALYTHPQRNVIYRSVGDRPKIEVDTFAEELTLGDRLVLCSDGLWEMVRDEGIEEILLREPDPQMACEALVERANLAGGSDNISIIVVNL